MARPSEPERLTITDPRVVRALAHPARLQMLDRLVVDGPQTATEFAQVTGLSPSACSYHLRQLAKYGLVTQVAPAAGGDGRERRWETALSGFSAQLADEEPTLASRAAGEALLRSLQTEASRRYEQWLRMRPSEPLAWQRAASAGHSILRLTPDELEELYVAMQALVEPYAQRLRPAGDSPEGARLVHLDIRLTPDCDAVTPAQTDLDGE